MVVSYARRPRRRPRCTGRCASSGPRAGPPWAAGWSRRAQLFALRPGAIAHAILLTDGHNEGETPDDLAMAVERCVGSFQCDCRGVGDDWDVEELRRISSALLGTVDIVREPEQLAAEFTAMAKRAMGRSVNDVGLRVWTPQGAEVVFLKQVAPGLEDLTDRRTDVDDLVGEYPTGASGEETRDYHLRIRVPAREIGERMLAGRAVLMVNGMAAAEGTVLAEWTDDEELSTRLHPDVAHATGQADLATRSTTGSKHCTLGTPRVPPITSDARSGSPTRPATPCASTNSAPSWTSTTPSRASCTCVTTPAGSTS